MSAVLTLPSLMTPKVAEAIVLAMESRLKDVLVRNHSFVHQFLFALPEMSEHHGSAEDHRGGVSSVGAHDIAGDVTATGLEQCVFLRKHQHPVFTLRSPSTPLTRPTLQPGTIPGPPTSAAPMLETMAPYKLGMTMTSNCCGRATSCMELSRRVRRV